jgi:hypothetical protein
VVVRHSTGQAPAVGQERPRPFEILRCSGVELCPSGGGPRGRLSEIRFATRSPPSRGQLLPVDPMARRGSHELVESISGR